MNFVDICPIRKIIACQSRPYAFNCATVCTPFLAVWYDCGSGKNFVFLEIVRTDGRKYIVNRQR